MSKALTALAVGSLSSLLITQTAVANQNPVHEKNQNVKGVTEFKKVMVKATRVEQDSDEVNRSVAIVNKEKLEETQANSVAEVASYQANISVAGGAVPGNHKINIRGLEGDKVLQVIDGARSNTNFSHRPSFFLDPELLQSFEIMKGPSSSLWGSGAIGGVVVQNTIEANDIIQEGNNSGGFIKQGYQDNGDAWTTTGSYATKYKDFDALVAGTYKNSDGMDQGNGDTLYGTEAINKTLLTKLGWNLDKHQRLAVQYRHSDLNGHPPTVGSSDNQENSSDALIDRLVKDTNVAIDYTHQGSSDLLNLNAKLYVNNTNNKEINTFDGTDKSDVKTLGMNLFNQFNFGNTKVLLGLDGYQDTIEVSRAVDSNSATGNRPEPPTKAETKVWGSFTKITHDINTQWQVEAGVRFDSFDTKSKDTGTSEDETALSPSAAVRWKTTDWMSWTLRYDEAFRAPSSYELYIEGTHFNYGNPGWDNTFIPNPDLKPEKAQNIELTLDLAFNNLLGKDSLALQATAFQNDVEDFIYLDVQTNPDFGPPPACKCVTGTSTHINATDAELWGYEIMADYQNGPFSASLSYGQTRGTHETTLGANTTEDHLDNIPADKWVADISYGFWNIDTKLGLRIMDVEKQNRIEFEEGSPQSYDGYTLTDIYATWEPSAAKLDGIKVDFVLANAFDQNYRQAWSEVSEPGRAARISAKYSF
ncbi:TonB-dependent hemoglobin/transferrin/lactoferrin family receptor [Litoribacillus peritrichatus]|uniref:TonB-dependent hemoglobin/transferrin/lactoferrin family receptor n=1 Tax=Litoribacillus peritrichatus TaxID=718191 RepID=A0ABP7MHQ8_9GAMM